ncbi:uncharacterized protein LOC123293556 [Chrysoperla carnea]|uniref:uncharacterized protein LOC123293556 n=1 Tax=Chrysoperla carnea TaxID=189513 RepID=UPI001D08D91E|nr:uncharacterized protein LOC123293556 [Chrysoperla carnea]
MQAQIEDPLLRIQREINEVVEREQELRNGYISPVFKNHNNNNYKRSFSPGESSGDELQNSLTPPLSNQSNDLSVGGSLSPSPPPPRVVQRAFSTSSLAFTNQFLPQKRFIPNPDQRGLMQRFIKSRGRLPLQPIAPKKDHYTTNYIIDPIKIQNIPPEKMTRKGYVPVEERIQKELREMQNREKELRAHRRKTLAVSQPNLLAILDDNDNPSSPMDSPPSTPKLRGARSYANLCEDSSLPSDTVSAPSSLRPAVSLAQLCDDLNESDVPTSSQLIAKFESIIQKNLQNGSVNHL